ncbi:MAG: metal ABC transporter permease, partial [Caldilineaceae bacterium]|nr:metal ABC transporter permease [Caldilineaceae bacterium]
AAAAYLLTDELRRMLLYSVVIGIVSAVGGYWMARWLDANIAGSMATVTWIVFVVIFLVAPNRGIVALAQRHRRQRWEFAKTMVAIHLLQHENGPDADHECRVDHLVEHLRWQPDHAEQVIRYAERKGAVRRHSGRLLLTDVGRGVARAALVQ